MTIMSDKWIIENSKKAQKPLIHPFHGESVSSMNGTHVTSFGTSSYGYDLRLGNKFKVLKSPNQVTGARIINPCDFDQQLFRDVYVEDGQGFVLAPQTFALAVSKEHMCMPRDITGICMQKSTIARAGLEVVVTPLEAGWEGFLTLELFNKTPFPIHLTVGMGIVQLLFFKGDQMAFGNLFQGVPFDLDDSMRSSYTGSFWALLNPFALLCGVVSLSLLTLQGATF